MSVAGHSISSKAKQREILSQIRDRILRGEWLPGDRIPSRPRLEADFGVRGMAIQRALDSLAADGFIHSRRRLGTFVAERLPCESRYGVLFATEPADPNNWRGFCTSLIHQFDEISERQSVEFEAYYRISDTGSSAYQKLLADSQAHRLAGLIVVDVPNVVRGTPLADLDGIPKVLIRSGRPSPGLPQVSLDHAQWIELALDRVAAKGRSRVAIITHGGLMIDHGEADLIQAAYRTRGLHWDPRLIQCGDLHHPQTATNLARLLVTSGLRPDALLITDDNLVNSALAGLIQERLSVPDDIMVVGHVNFPQPGPPVLKIERLGFQSCQVLEQCVSLLERLKKGQNVPARTYLSPVYEDDFTSDP